MRVGPIAHGALLVAALGFAYQTWTRDKTETPKVGTVTVWDESVSDFEAFAYDGASKSLRIERREEGGQPYYWGQLRRTEKKRKPRSPVKGPADENVVSPQQGHGVPGTGHGAPASAGKPGTAGKPGATSKQPEAGKPAAPGSPAPASGDKKADPSKTGAGSGSSTKPPPQRALSPHHAGTDQAEQSKPATPGQSTGAGTGPAKPAAGSTPAKPGADKKPATGDKPAATSAAPASAPGDDEDEAEEGEGDSPDTDSAEPAPAPEETTTKVKEFPVGKDGETLIENLSHLRALRDLGVLTDKQKDEYSLTSSKDNLTVFFKGGKQHSLIIGARVFGSGDRYVMNSDSGRGYVISNSEIMRHIDGGEASLSVKSLHAFQEETPEQSESAHDPRAPKPKLDKYPGVGQVDVETASGSRSAVRFEQPDPQTGGTKIGWADKKKPGESDVTFANFLTQIERLRPLEYDPTMDLAALTKVLTITYKKSSGEVMGTFQLFKKEPTLTPELEPSEESKKDNQAEYFVKTELTRVAGKVGTMSAERVTDDLPQLFGAPPKKQDKRPAPSGGTGKPLPGKAGAAKPPTGNPASPVGDKPAPAGARSSNPKEGPAAKPSGSKPNPTEGNK